MTHSAHFSRIIISPDRQRKDFEPEALTDLAISIQARGLMHPIVVRQTSSGVVLVAGERRLRAIEQLAMTGADGIMHNGQKYLEGLVPYVTLGELSPLEAEEAELDENLRRKDLTWQEESAAIARLHKLRQEQALLAGTTHSLANTFEELREAQIVTTNYGDTREMIILADHLSNPDVLKAKSPKDAMKLLKKQEAAVKNKELAERVGATFHSSTHQLFHSDCTVWLDDAPSETFDVILTDPPYGMGADSFGDGAGRLGNSEHHYKDDDDTWRTLMRRIMPNLFRVAKPQAHAYVFCDIEKFFELKSMMEKEGWYVFRTPIINYKPNSGRVPLPEHGPRRQYEICLYAIKGKKPVTAIYSDVIPTTLEENLTHGAQKPIELYVNLLRRSVRPGDMVLDCFAGSGTIFPAAHELKVRATGVEMSSEYYGIAVKRLESLDGTVAA
jgi:site-specific DNA-methyltransferase (adenine-specific)